MRARNKSRRGDTDNGVGCFLSLAVVLAVGLVVVAGLWWSGRKVQTALAEELATTKLERDAAIAQLPKCSEFAAKLAGVGKLLQDREYALAAQAGELELKQIPSKCEELRLSLAGLIYQAQMRDLFEHQTRLDEKTAMERYQAIIRKASDNGLPKNKQTHELTVAGDAYNLKWWALVRFVFVEGWKNEDINHDSISAADLYMSALRNAGRELCERGSTICKEQGGKLLHTAHKISVAYTLKKEEARADLREFFGEDESKWPPHDLTDVILQAVAVKK